MTNYMMVLGIGLPGINYLQALGRAAISGDMGNVWAYSDMFSGFGAIQRTKAEYKMGSISTTATLAGIGMAIGGKMDYREKWKEKDYEIRKLEAQNPATKITFSPSMGGKGKGIDLTGMLLASQMLAPKVTDLTSAKLSSLLGYSTVTA